jgi:hypothetical protein
MERNMTQVCSEALTRCGGQQLLTAHQFLSQLQQLLPQHDDHAWHGWPGQFNCVKFTQGLLCMEALLLQMSGKHNSCWGNCLDAYA